MSAIVKPLSAAARDVLRQLFLQGPTWDGDISSKSGRAELVEMGYAARHEGFAFITEEGMKLALDAGLGREKGRWQQERSRRSELHGRAYAALSLGIRAFADPAYREEIESWMGEQTDVIEEAIRSAKDKQP